jgi:hypothetical protein
LFLSVLPNQAKLVFSTTHTCTMRALFFFFYNPFPLLRTGRTPMLICCTRTKCTSPLKYGGSHSLSQSLPLEMLGKLVEVQSSVSTILRHIRPLLDIFLAAFPLIFLPSRFLLLAKKIILLL